MNETAKSTNEDNGIWDEELIQVFTGKTIDEVFSEYTLPELNRLASFLLFIRFV